MKTLFLLFGAAVIGQAQGITVSIAVTNTQATFSYISPVGGACTLEVSEFPGYSPLVHDVDTGLFPGSNSDSRSTALSSGTSRVFIVGTRSVELASDSKYYSRALQVAKLHYYLLSCGANTAAGTFTTVNIPTGNTRNDAPQVKAADGTTVLPTITNTRGQQIVDPQTGALLIDMTIPSDSTGTMSGLSLGDGGLTRQCDNTLRTAPDTTQGYFCTFNNDSGGGSAFWVIPATGESRFLGFTPANASPYVDANLNWLVYRPDLTPVGVYNEQYVGNFTSGSMVLGTPVLINQYGLCTALNAFDSTFVIANFQCSDARIIAGQYTSFFFPAVGGPSQDVPGWIGVIYGDSGPPFNPSCTTAPCPRIVAAWWIGNGNSYINHNWEQVPNADGLIEVNLKNAGGTVCPYGPCVLLGFWDYLSDPHGSAIIVNPTTYNEGGHLDFGATGPGPNGPTYGLVQEGGSAYQTVLGYPAISTFTSGAVAFNIIDPNQPFAGATSPAAYAEVRHPYWGQDSVQSDANNRQTFWDALPLSGGGTSGTNNITNCTLDSGQRYICTSPQPINRKQQDTLAASQAQSYVDVSGPGACPGSVTNCIGTTSADAGKYCIANVVNECVNGSAVGEIFISPWSTSSFQPICYGGETPNISFPSACITNQTMYMGGMVQFWGTGASESSPKSRVLSKGLALGPAFMPAFATAKPLADSSWMLMEVGLNNSFSPSQIWAAKIPPYPTPDGVDRTTFIPAPISISTPGGHSIATATVEFWYTEYGTGNYCTSRAETCLVVASTVTASPDPFWFKSTDTYTKAPCVSSCTIALPVLPLHTAYWAVKFYDGSGSFVMDGDVGVAVEGNVITLGLPPTTPIASVPIGIGPDQSAGAGVGIVKFFDWVTATPSGCTNGTNGTCVGVESPAGDTFFGQAWMPNASGLPNPSGLPIVGTLNDNTFTSGGSTICNNNVSVLQLDVFNWSSLNASHFFAVNCMTDYGPAVSQNVPAGWNSHCTGLDGATERGLGWNCTWKNTTMTSIGGNLYLPIFRQITTGHASVHDSTIVMSPDSGKHWCNPYTFAHRSGSPGCDSSNWSATGDAPLCASGSGTTPCTDSAYLDATHSSMMWNANLGTQMPLGTYDWTWVNYGNQDGTTPPSGVNDGCDPNTYACWMLGDGTLGRVPLTSIMDISTWQYYTCPAITDAYRCSGLASSSWTSTFTSRTSFARVGYYAGPYFQVLPTQNYTVLYVKEFGSYLYTGITYPTNNYSTTDFFWAPAPYGPWTQIHVSTPNFPFQGFQSLAPALYYNVVSATPPHVQIGFENDAYVMGNPLATPQFMVWDFVQGRSTYGGDNFGYADYTLYKSNAGYQFDDGHLPNSFPRNGLIWSFDFLDQGMSAGQTDWPFFIDSANHSAVLTPCSGPYVSPTSCGSMNSGTGTAMDNYGIVENQNGSQYEGHFESAHASFDNGTAINAPTAMQGNGTYSVVGVYRQDATTEFGRPGGIWSTGTLSTSDNTIVELNAANGTLQLNWGAAGATTAPGYKYVSNFTFTTSNYYFVAVTVQAATGGNCAAASIWVGQSGTVADSLAGATCTAFNTPSSKTPAVVAAPLVLGMNVRGNPSGSTGEPFVGGQETTMIYNRALSSPEVQFAYQSMKTQMAKRGITLQ